MTGCTAQRTLPVVGLALLAFMVVVTSHPENSVVHKRSYNSGGSGDNKLASSGAVTVVGSPFATPNRTVVVAQIGGTATLPCNIKKHNQGVVTWIRKRDHHLLTVGPSTYSHDGRFQVTHARHVPASWPLVVRKVQQTDAGMYECQLSTHPPSSILLQLRVVEAYAEIEGAPDIHVRSGSELRLLCRLQGATESPSYLFWYHGEHMINYDTSRGVLVTSLQGGSTAPPPKAKGGAPPGKAQGPPQGFGSELRLAVTGQQDGGNYSCVPANVKPTFVTVHVHDDAACPPLSQGVRPGQDPGLIVQCPLATKDRQDIKPEPSESNQASNVLHPLQNSFFNALKFTCILILVFNKIFMYH